MLLICGSLVAELLCVVECWVWWWRGCSVAEVSSVMVARSLVADAPIVFILLVADEEFLDEEEEEGVLRRVLEEEGESAPLSRGGLGNRLRNQLCLSAMFGVILCAGSHSRQRRMKSRNSGSLQPFSATCER